MSNVFTYDRRIILALVDSKGTLSGALMKNINFRQPQVIENLKLKAPSLKVGDFARIKDYLFIVVKKDYRNKLSENDIEVIFKKLPDEVKKLDIKTTSESYSEFKDSLKKHFSFIEFCDTSEWDMGRR